MNGACHRVAGVTTGVILAHIVEPQLTLPTLAISVLASQVGSLIPDIDEPNSIVGKKVKLLSGVIKKIFGHRGIIHTPFFLLLINLGLLFLKDKVPDAWINYYYLTWIAFDAGYLSHLLLDFLTPYGLMIFFPISSEKFRLFGIRGQYRDLFISVICVMILIIFLLFRYDVVMLNEEVLKIG